MEQTRSKTEQLEWRRNKVNELSVKGFGLTDISKMLQIPKTTISRDIEYLRERANETIRNHIQKKLPYEYTKCISGLEEIIKESWIIIAHSEKIGNTKDKISSLALIKDTYNTKMDLLTNTSLLQDSIKFVEQNKESLTSNEGSQTNYNNHTLAKLANLKDKERNGLEGSTEDNSDQSEQFNQVF
jgi:hypothetical protein